MGDKEEENKLVEQTEEKISWPYMTIKSFSTSLILKVATVGAIWGWGYMNWSIGWLLPPVILSVWKVENSRSAELKRLTAQAAVMAREKDVITSRLDELPSWVYFPDFDRVEWLNKILYKVWPGMNHLVRDIVKEKIQPAIVQSLSEYKMTGFQFGRLVLGRIPPKVYGIKVYETNTSRSEIILDCDILYAGDCDISFSLGNIKGGIRDFQLRGMARVVLKPMLNVVPLVGGFQLFFLNNPSIDFNLVGIADVLDFPGFNQALRKVIKEQVSAIAVLPNKIIVPLSEDVPAEVLKMPEPEGVLRIHVVQAKHLMKKDIGMLGKGKSDPYAVINIGAQEFRTKTIDNTVDPKWDYWCEAIINTRSSGLEVAISLWDWDPNFPGVETDDLLGRASIEVSKVKKRGTIDNWFTLEFAKHGMVHLRLTWLSLSKNVADLQAALLETQQLRVTSMSTAILTLFVDSAKNLPCLRGSKQPDVYLEASVGNKTERTATMLRSCDPIWEQGFTFLVGNPETSSLNIRILDDKTGSVVGTLTYSISMLMTKLNLEDMQHPYDLQNADPESKVIMSMSLHLLKYETPEINIEEEEDEEDFSQLQKKIERQESNISFSQGSSVPSTPLKKQPSKESIHSVANSTVSSSAAVPPAGEVEKNIESEMIILSESVNNSSAHPQLIQRHFSITSSAGDWKLGRIQLTLRYSVPRQKLVVVVHKVANLPLPLNDPSNIPDPYVKLYLLPDRHKETKRKTAVLKDNCNPIYDEQFEYIVSQGDLNERILEISVCTQKAWLSSSNNIMGQVRINLSEIDVTQAFTNWYDLMPEVKKE
ncbi:extended synaptotagmin-2 isoform X1 [Cotesia glomerata]|uniref:extended synaptotagmin-2 isoform X1 n=1 Tax=Cotesia glomerata TaxID=32391 RepID=UPI001D012C67|nr:extended synaptotagmin-2 isoform X1 [Cotesia glomerata]XP_044595359.1 extended synaptotagmin-2 isoform X1 [Cotesia glomerata]